MSVWEFDTQTKSRCCSLISYYSDREPQGKTRTSIALNKGHYFWSYLSFHLFQQYPKQNARSTSTTREIEILQIGKILLAVLFIIMEFLTTRYSDTYLADHILNSPSLLSRKVGTIAKNKNIGNDPDSS